MPGCIGSSILDRCVKAAAALIVVGAASAALARPLPLATTPNDVFVKGTQPGGLLTQIFPADTCQLCHLGFDDPATTVKPHRWRGSLHGHSMKDPIFRAGLAIANQDVGEAAQLCIRCHSPSAWLEERASPATGINLTNEDINHGVQCHVCHRMVNPVYVPGQSPPDDQMILDDLAMAGNLPTQPGDASYVIDPSDVRRGPFADTNPPHPWAFSPFHRSGNLCGTCHDVSNPVFSRVGGAIPMETDSYTPNALDTAHPTGDKYDQFPEQRTYSEWLNSSFAQGGVDMGGRFGGNRTVVSQCQDCHMPAVTGYGCEESFFNPPLRNDLPYHSFAGANITALDLLLNVYTPADPFNPGPFDFDETTITLVNRQKIDNLYMIENATDLEAGQAGCSLTTRLINQCGHKLLTGYPEGRRIFYNVKFYDSADQLLYEHGSYNFASAVLSGADTKIYETKHGLDASMAALTGLPEGPSFHLTLVNKVFKDNRIPPRGFTNAAFEAVQAGHTGAHYEDGEHWDDTLFSIPSGAVRADVIVYYQTVSLEYAEFLRDTNTNPAPNDGTVFWNAYVATGKSAPHVMDEFSIKLAPNAASLADIAHVINNWGRTVPNGTDGDYNRGGSVGLDDIARIVANWNTACPTAP